MALVQNRGKLAAFCLTVSGAVAACGGGEGSADVPEGWEVHESAELGYVMALAPDWVVSSPAGASEVKYAGPRGAEIRVTRYVDEDGWPADTLFLGAEADARDLIGSEPTLINQLTLADGSRAQIYVAQFADHRGARLFQRAVVLDAPDLWYVDWYSDATDQGGHRQHFLDIVRTFAPRALLPAEQEG